MHKVWALVLTAMLVLSTACGHLCGPVTVTASHVADQTVALVHQDKDGDWGAYCSGVWVSEHRILTASHCVDDRTGTVVAFITKQEEPELYETPIRTHSAVAIIADGVKDLALLDVSEIIDHPVARLSEASPNIGVDLLVMGHPIGLTWTLLPAQVAAYRERLNYVTNTEGPFMQLASGIIGGNSGGGVFTKDGDLVGIVLLRSPAPYIGFACHTSTIRRFLALHAQ